MTERYVEPISSRIITGIATYPGAFLMGWLGGVIVSQALDIPVRPPVPIEKDLDGNGIPEVFYEIGGERAYVSINGSPLEKITKEGVKYTFPEFSIPENESDYQRPFQKPL